MKMSKISECIYSVMTSNMTSKLISEKYRFTQPGKSLIIKRLT